MNHRSRYFCRVTVGILVLALIQGLIYLFMVPPWQHYDEPSHFEYAWLMAELNQRPSDNDVSFPMRRTLFESMIEHRFFRDLGDPPDIHEDQPPLIGYSALRHPPLYYGLVSLPLRLVPTTDITTRLYLARGMSLLLFLLTIAVVIGIMRDLTPEGHPLRWAVPVVLVLLGPFVDVMTSVNSDVGATLIATVFLWGAVRTIRFGFHWSHLLWLCSTAIVAIFTKNTAVYTVLLIPLVLLLAFWVRRGWSWRWLAGSVAVLLVGGLFLTVGWGDAAYWYRWIGSAEQPAPTRVTHPDMPVGTHALLLEATPGGSEQRLLSPLLASHVAATPGETITFGAWIWANRPATVYSPGISVSNRPGRAFVIWRQPIEITTGPQFVSWTYQVPADTVSMVYVFSVPKLPANAAPLRVYLDGAVVAEGTFPTDEPPVFATSAAQQGTWGEKAFTNLLRNPSAEQAGPRLRSWVEPLINQVVSPGGGRTPAQLLMVAYDGERMIELFGSRLTLFTIDNLFTGLAWGNVMLPTPLWYVFRAFLLLACIGALLWWFQRSAVHPPEVRTALLLLALAGMIVWTFTITRSLPRISDGYVIPVARYTYPAIVPTILLMVGGWRALWPHHLQRTALWVLVAAMLLLNVANIANAVWFFYVR